MLRFTIRDLLLLMLIVGLGLGWALRERQQMAEVTLWKDRAEVLKALVEVGNTRVIWDQARVGIETERGVHFYQKPRK